MSAAPILEVQDLRITAARAGETLVAGMSFEVRAGETVGIVGASGEGKTLTALAILGLLPQGLEAMGSVRWRGREVLGLKHSEMREIRGAEIGFVAQDAMTALHPFMRVNRQVAESLEAHHPLLPRADALTQADALLRSMGLQPQPSAGAGFPFQWSGGMRQRALIAMAVASRPMLLIADEPTTALDLSTQTIVLTLLRDIQRQMGSALLLITHDIAVISQLTDRVVVVGGGGRVVEAGSIAELREQPRHRDTVRLVNVLRAEHRTDSPPAVPEPRADTLLHVSKLTVRYANHRRLLRPAKGWTTAVEDATFSLRAGETIGIVGESGGGKSTLARALVGLIRPHAGSVLLDGLDLTRFRGRALRRARSSIQLVFQDPASSLNPRRRAGASIAQPLHAHGRYDEVGGERRVLALLEAVGLPAAHATRFPHELSGGERQRVAIARALALEPRVLVLDEPVTSLDAAARAGILHLLRELQREHGIAQVLIAHDLRMVRGLAHEIAVMQRGRFVEVAPAARLFASPSHPYTRELLALTPPCACCAVRLPGSHS